MQEKRERYLHRLPFLENVSFVEIVRFINTPEQREYLNCGNVDSVKMISILFALLTKATMLNIVSRILIEKLHILNSVKLVIKDLVNLRTLKSFVNVVRMSLKLRKEKSCFLLKIDTSVLEIALIALVEKQSLANITTTKWQNIRQLLGDIMNENVLCVKK